MKLLVIVLCLLSERFLIHAVSYQRFSWYSSYCDFMQTKLDKNQYVNNPWIFLIATILPIILITTLVYYLLQGIFFGFMGLILSVALFYYCLGPQNAFYPLTDKSKKASNFDSVGLYFAQVNSQLFSVLFWYILGGPIAALTYRLISLSKDISNLSPQATYLTDLLEWVPARLTVLLYLLAGNFQRGFNRFFNFIMSSPDSNNTMLAECGIEAVRSTDTDDVPLVSAETLVEHATIVLLVFLALFTLVAWL